MKILKSHFLTVSILSIVLLFSVTSYAQVGNFQGIRLNDGSVIYGKVLQVNVEKVSVEDKDGKISVYNFRDVQSFIKEGQDEAAPAASKGTIEVTKGPNKEKKLVSFIVDIKPLSVLVSPNIDGFSVTKTTPGIIYTDVISGVGNWIPQLKLGVGFNLPALFIDLYGGVGYLYNRPFSASMYLGDVAFRFKLGEHITLGPHIGVVSLNPTWNGWGYSGSDDVKLGSTTGVMGGIVFTAGGEMVSFSMAVDYLNASFDVKTYNGWTANKNSLDVSGMALLMGVLFRF